MRIGLEIGNPASGGERGREGRGGSRAGQGGGAGGGGEGKGKGNGSVTPAYGRCDGGIRVTNVLWEGSPHLPLHESSKFGK